MSRSLCHHDKRRQAARQRASPRIRQHDDTPGQTAGGSIEAAGSPSSAPRAAGPQDTPGKPGQRTGGPRAAI